MPHRFTAFRLSANIFAIFIVIGIFVPFLPVWLGSRGVSTEQIGLILAAALWAKVPVGVFITTLADRSGRRKGLLIASAGVVLAGFATFTMLQGFWPLLFGWLVVGSVVTTLIPLADSLTVIAVQDGGVDYGKVRRWGSISFIIVTVLGGLYLTGKASDAILLLLIGGSALIVLSALYVPALSVPPRAASGAALLDLLRNRTFLIFVVTASILQASHAALYGFATLTWKQAGISETVIGLLWAEGVLVEILLFTFGDRLVDRMGVWRLYLAAGVAGILRWTVLASSTAVPVLVAVQSLHALTFAATHMASIAFIVRYVPRDQSATAQGVYDGMAMGFVFGLGMAAAGWIYELHGQAVFLLSAGFSAVGVLGALLMRRRG